MPTLKQIAYNCKKATFLIEKKQEKRLSVSEYLQLRYHLTGCSVCRLYRQQSEMINRVLRQRPFYPDTVEMAADTAYKQKLKEMIAGFRH